MDAVRETIISLITTRPTSTILAKASGDFMFSSFYMLILGLTVLGIVNLTMRMNNRSRKHIAAVNIIISVLLVLTIAGANMVFWLIRSH